MKLAVVGSRGFNNYEFLCETLDKIKDVDTIVSGGAKGADSLGARYAKDRKLKLIEFKPDWNKFGKSAGFKRNIQIVDECDKLVAFWDGVSKGTKHSIDLATKQNKLLLVTSKFDDFKIKEWIENL